jgi:hypothetical protein
MPSTGRPLALLVRAFVLAVVSCGVLTGAGIAEVAKPVPPDAVRKKFQKHTYSGDCTDNNGCSLEIATVGRRKLLEIDNVSCRVTVKKPNSGGEISVQTRYGVDYGIVEYYPLTLVQSVPSVDVYAMNVQTQFFAKARGTIRFDAWSSANIIGFDCKIAGELIVLR